MVTFDALRNVALSLSGVIEKPHFEKISYSTKKGVFLTYDDKTHIACVKLKIGEQSEFASKRSNDIYPVPNKWGQKGWTFIELQRVQLNILTEIVKAAYHGMVASK